VCPAFLVIPPAQFKLVLDAVIWALKHTMRHVADTGLSILYQLLRNIAEVDSAAAQSFYQTYYVDVLQHLFSVVTDSSHTAGSQSVFTRCFIAACRLLRYVKTAFLCKGLGISIPFQLPVSVEAKLSFVEPGRRCARSLSPSKAPGISYQGTMKISVRMLKTSGGL